MGQSHENEDSGSTIVIYCIIFLLIKVQYKQHNKQGLDLVQESLIYCQDLQLMTHWRIYKSDFEIGGGISA